MQRPNKYPKIFIVFILLGAATGMTVRPKITLPQEELLPKAMRTHVVPPPVAPEPTPTPLPQTRILFVGDMNLGRCIAKKTLISQDYTNNYNYSFEFVADKTRAADFTVGSLDGTLSDESLPMPCPDSMNLIGPTHMVEGLQFAGFDVITVATNHIKDCGEKGYECENKSLLDTINTLKTAGIQPVGAGVTLAEARQPVIVERNGIRFAFLGINQINEEVWAAENTPGTAPLAHAYIGKIKDEIASAKQIADVVIVLPHWGVEYAAKTDDIQKVWARDFISAGASLVIGNHPHITQPMEVFSDKLIFYSLGNFVFDQKRGFQRESIALEVSFAGAEIESWELHPVSINYYTFQTHWADDAEAEFILARAKSE
jgi:hypothetical protein